MSNEDEETKVSHVSPFETIRRESDEGIEYWSARDLAEILGYSQWRNFKYAIEKAQIACKNSGNNPTDHFAGSSKMVEVGSGAQREREGKDARQGVDFVVKDVHQGTQRSFAAV